MTTTSDPVESFYSLFRGRTDALGTWGGSANHCEVSRAHFEAHLTSHDPADWIGVYPLGYSACSWGCVDVDGGDFPLQGARDSSDYDRKNPVWHDWPRMLDIAEDLVIALSVHGIHGHIERTRNGYHVWVFPEQIPVKATYMRRALLAACESIGYQPKEVNPKQESLEPGQLGNYVRLPYPGALSVDPPPSPERHFLGVDGLPLTIESFVPYAKLTPTLRLEEASRYWRPPIQVSTVDVNAGLEVKPILSKIGGDTGAITYTIWRDGPLPGSDRSGTLAHLAHLCREGGLTLDEAYAVIASADWRWGKFQPAGRADAEQQLLAIVERAFAS